MPLPTLLRRLLLTLLPRPRPCNHRPSVMKSRPRAAFLLPRCSRAGPAFRLGWLNAEIRAPAQPAFLRTERSRAPPAGLCLFRSVQRLLGRAAWATPWPPVADCGTDLLTNDERHLRTLPEMSRIAPVHVALLTLPGAPRGRERRLRLRRSRPDPVPPSTGPAAPAAVAAGASIEPGLPVSAVSACARPRCRSHCTARFAAYNRGLYR